MKILSLWAAAMLGAFALAGCKRPDTADRAPAPSRGAGSHQSLHDGRDGPVDAHQEHERHPRSIHSTLERATGEAPDHTGTEKP